MRVTIISQMNFDEESDDVQSEITDEQAANVLEDLAIEVPFFECDQEESEPQPPFQSHHDRNLTRWRETSIYSMSPTPELAQALDDFEEVFRVSQDKQNNAVNEDYESCEQICRLVLASAETSDDTLSILRVTDMMMQEMRSNGIDAPSIDAYYQLVNYMLEQYTEQVQFFRAVLMYPFWLSLTDDCISNFAQEEGERNHVIYSITQKIVTQSKDLPQFRKRILESIANPRYLTDIGTGEVPDSINQLLLFLKAAKENPVITYSFYTQAYEGNTMRRFRNFVCFISETVESTILGKRSVYGRLPGFKKVVDEGVENINFGISYKKQIRLADAGREKRPYHKSGAYSKKNKDCD